MTYDIKHWRTLEYHDPAMILRRLTALGRELEHVEMEDRVRRLRTSGLKRYREGRDAAIFCYGLGLGKEVPMFYSLSESSDYDFVATWVEGSTQHYCAVQLKELVPIDLNPNATIEDLLNKQMSRPPSQTVLAVKLNRRGSADLSSLHIPRVPFGQLWFFWASSPDAKRWTLYGDALTEPGYFTYEYPE